MKVSRRNFIALAPGLIVPDVHRVYSFAAPPVSAFLSMKPGLRWLALHAVLREFAERDRMAFMERFLREDSRERL